MKWKASTKGFIEKSGEASTKGVAHHSDPENFIKNVEKLKAARLAEMDQLLSSK
jgi:hypothetical protein